MGTTRRAYGTWSRTMLRSLRDKGHLKVEALVSWLNARQIPIDRTLVSHWVAGRTHLPADLLPLLADFSGRPELVFGAFVRDVDYELVHIPTSIADDEDLVDLLLTVGALVGRLQLSLCEARSPDSPGGIDITDNEREALRTRLDDLIHLLADIRARLKPEGPRLHATSG